MKFDLPQELSSIIKVIGVGGGGSNAVNHMYEQGIKGVDFIICNTDKQALEISPVPVKLQLGPGLTEGLGAGAQPERGKDAAHENLEDIRQLLGNRTKMIFITAGMGGGTGTGAAPVIANVARELGILSVGIVTSPFQWEGRRRKQQALSGIEELRNAVDTLLVINNDRLRDLFGNLSLDTAFAHADNVLTTAARGIAEIITKTGTVNVDFEDVKTVMTRSGAAIMGMAEAEGEDRSLRAAQEALASPLLNDNDIKGAKFVLLNIEHGTRPLLMDEIGEITDFIQDEAGSGADVIFGYGTDESLGERVRITVIATGFNTNTQLGEPAMARNTRTVIPLDAEVPTMITQPILNPVAGTVLPQATEVPAEAPSSEPYLKAMESSPEQTPEPVKAPQRTIEFDIDQPPPPMRPAAQEESAPMVKHTLYDDQGSSNSNTATQEQPRVVVGEARLSPGEHQNRVEDRMSRIREMSSRLRTPNGVADYEREPAYKRKNVQLSDGPASADSNVSRYTLSEGVDEHGERRVELKRNNPYLHDNVD
ncbi:MAG: cell division protein FtsZ [Flavobacteriales bacterium]|nr:cell division protein FtsZ [Flavobacteriales bacterium]